MLAKLAADKFLKDLDGLERGILCLTTPDGKTRWFGSGQGETRATLEVHDWRVFLNLALHGDRGFLEDYQGGLWEAESLQDLFILAQENEPAVKDYIHGSFLSRLFARLYYMLRRNSLNGSKKNIHDHYDLGNDFYRLWLDQTMTYSAALFHDDEKLPSAQQNKYDRILNRLNKASGSLLEIGCGWGGFADHALDKGDYDITGITLSREQHDFARDRLQGQATIRLEDYRTQNGRFDNIVSIEMFEAVGEEYWPVYFEKVSDLLDRRGTAVLQTITMNEDYYEDYKSGTDFIRSYIFPGGMLPSVSRFKESARQAGLKTGDEFHFGDDYAKTLQMWLDRFDSARSRVMALGFDESFVRLWRFYLSGCIAGFKTGRTNVMQVELSHA